MVAPALTPQAPGGAGLKLARLLRAGLLTEVRTPSPAEEAVRDLCQTRYTGTHDLTRSRNRLKMFLLRRNRVARGLCHWARGHHEWLRAQTFEEPADTYTYQDLYRSVVQLEARLKALDGWLAHFAEQVPYREVVARLRCFRGVDTQRAMTLVTEPHGFGRFTSPRKLVAYLGLVPSECSSGARQRRGGVTKTGRPPSVSVTVKRRRKGQPPEGLEIGERAQHRLHRRYWRLVLSGKHRAGPKPWWPWLVS